MRIISVLLFAAGTYAAIHELGRAGDVPEHGPQEACFMVLCLTIIWCKYISPEEE